MNSIICTICGGKCQILVSAGELQEEKVYVEHFYRKRIRARDYSPRRNFVHREELSIACCPRCRHIFRHPPLSPETTLARYREEKYVRARLETMYQIYSNAFRATALSLREILPPDPQILEIGAYTGGFLNACREAGLKRIVGLDICADIINFLREKGFDIRQDYPAATQEQFDCICVWSCFDQLPEPQRDLQKINQLLRPGGRLLLRFPNAEFYRLLHLKAPSFLSKSSFIRNLGCYTTHLGFTFRHGYSTTAIQQLLTLQQLPLRLTRCRGLQLLSVSSGNSLARWATWEEWLYNQILQLLSRLRVAVVYLPWLEVTLVKTV